MNHRNFNIIESEVSPKPAAAPKKTYQKPEITYLAPLEAMAVICVLPGKTDLGSGCTFTES